jgi:hypothetical protein
MVVVIVNENGAIPESHQAQLFAMPGRGFIQAALPNGSVGAPAVLELF